MAETAPAKSTFSISFNAQIFIVAIAIFLLLVFHFRHKIRAYLDERHNRLRFGGFFYVPADRGSQELSSFEQDLEDGLHSATFSLEGNLNGDTRKGLSEQAKLDIKGIMESNNVSFDKARLIYTQRELDRNGIDKDGLPRDPKLVTF